MARPKAIVEYTRNGVLLPGGTLQPLVLSLKVTDYFDQNLTPSKLELVVMAQRQSANPYIVFNWQYGDSLQVNIRFEGLATNFYESEVFYLDYVVENKDALETYTLGFLASIFILPVTYGGFVYRLTNTTVLDGAELAADALSLVLEDNLPNDTFLGVHTINEDNTTSADAIFEASSEIEMFRYICNTFGYFGNIKGNIVNIEKLETFYNDPQSIAASFEAPQYDAILSFRYRSQYNNLYKRYTTAYKDSTSFLLYNLTPAINVSNKVQNLATEGAYSNFVTARERAYGEMLKDYVENFEIEMSVLGDGAYIAGAFMGLPSSYGIYAGTGNNSIRLTEVNHSVTNQGWITTLRGFPIKQVYETSTVIQPYQFDA